MGKGIDITIFDSKGNKAKIDDERYGAARLQYAEQISDIDSAEHDELVHAYAKYAVTLDVFKAEQAEMNIMAEEFKWYWGEKMSEYEKDIRLAAKAGAAMYKQKGVKEEDVEAFAREQQRIIEEKHKEVLADYARAGANAKYLDDRFRAKWDGHPDVVAYQGEYAAIKKKYKKLRRAAVKPNPLHYLILTKRTPTDSGGPV